MGGGGRRALRCFVNCTVEKLQLGKIPFGKYLISNITAPLSSAVHSDPRPGGNTD